VCVCVCVLCVCIPVPSSKIRLPSTLHNMSSLPSGLILIPWPYKHAPWHSHNSQFTLPQRQTRVKVSLGQQVLEPRLLQEALQEHCRVRQLGNVVLVDKDRAAESLRCAKPYCFVRFFSDQAAAAFTRAGAMDLPGGIKVTSATLRKEQPQ
jgi:hypothetical protein